MKTAGNVLRSILAPVLGFVVISLGTILTFNVLFGQPAPDAPASVLIPGTIGAVLSGLLGGLTAGFIAPWRPILHAAAIWIFIAIDTTSVLRNSGGAIWFDLAGSGILALTALFGGYLASKWKKSPAAPPFSAGLVSGRL